MVSYVGSIAAIVAAAILLAGLGGMAGCSHRARPWLVVLFEINSRRHDVSRETLRGVEPVDVLLLVMAGAAYTGFWPGPGASHVVWMTLAIAQPLLGIPLLLGTRLLGRSGLMGGALVLSILMLVDGTWTATGGWARRPAFSCSWATWARQDVLRSRWRPSSHSAMAC